MEALKLENHRYGDYLALAKNNEQHLELIFGDIYRMAGASAAHQDVVGNLFYLLKTIYKDDKKCLPRIAPFDLKLDVQGEINSVQPDVLLLCKDNKRPCAIFEVLSPSTAYKDKTIKKKLYELAGIREYFLVDIEQKLVETFILNQTTRNYDYDQAYGLEDVMDMVCLNKTLAVDEILEGLDDRPA